MYDQNPAPTPFVACICDTQRAERQGLEGAVKHQLGEHQEREKHLCAKAKKCQNTRTLSLHTIHMDAFMFLEMLFSNPKLLC